jgi:regulatory protein
LAPKKQKFTLDEALERLEEYCAKQERSRYQVEIKLYDWGIPTPAHDDIIFELIQENFLNEARFALAYARSKMRMNQWGRLKIKARLRQHRVSNYNIDAALKSLDAETYENNIVDLIAKKWRTLSGDLSTYHRKQKVIRFLLQRGFVMAELSPHMEDLD